MSKFVEVGHPDLVPFDLSGSIWCSLMKFLISPVLVVLHNNFPEGTQIYTSDAANLCGLKKSKYLPCVLVSHYFCPLGLALRSIQINHSLILLIE
jgi:hypothetical protein